MTKPVTIQYAFPATPYGQKEGEERERAGAPRSFALFPSNAPASPDFSILLKKQSRIKTKRMTQK